MKSIEIAQGKFATVDDDDYECLSTEYWWWFHKDESHPIGYAQGQHKLSKKHVYMHRVIAERMGIDVSGKLVDHINLNTLQNTRSNLRPATHSQSQHNKGLQCNNKSGYKGVSWWNKRELWIVQLNKGRKKFARCYFRSLLDAAQASMLLRYLAHGEFANLD
jgi:hypothetical protein